VVEVEGLLGIVPLSIRSRRLIGYSSIEYCISVSRKPTTFATCMFEGKNKLVLGLPGNPVSATVTSHLYVLPAIRKMSGYTSPLGTIVKATVSILKCLTEQENSGFDLKQNCISLQMRIEAPCLLCSITTWCLRCVMIFLVLWNIFHSSVHH